ncbi:hypothetical protein DPMN_077285 [Dreissena polymorpha]|uniref:Uncharacterized protein n=1 Tax=Dreissena polymorpha TaxID=45954 RepID=A0A9D4BN55_DREPO|nr:hypothetical protein DPMN_077285 [Dreissena polymorpha]
MAEKMHTPLTLSATSEYNGGMQDFTDLTFTLIPKHKDSTEAFIKGDSFLQTQITTCSPYTANPTLRCECSCS